jgi:Uma2 family endonuclease
MVQKKLYARSGVKEYWIVIPEEKEIEVHILESPSLRFENKIKRDILR